MTKGLVIRNTGSWYIVKTESSEEIPCKVKGNFRLKGIRSTNPVVVGDRVRIEKNNEGSALIVEIEERKNYIIRKASNLSKQSHILAANIDAALLIVTVSQPVTSTTFIDRFLATAEAYSVPVYLIFNKIDLHSEEEKEYCDAMIRLYSQIGYDCLKISAKQRIGIEELEKVIHQKTVLISGHSGVGKSSLINCIVPHASLRTADISSVHNSGIHTTTFSEMIPLQTGGYLIDTPGIKGFGTFDLTPEEVSSFFKEIFVESKHCKFNNCTHRHEPGCAVLKAVEEHRISESRYQSYLNILEDEVAEKYR